MLRGRFAATGCSHAWRFSTSLWRLIDHAEKPTQN